MVQIYMKFLSSRMCWCGAQPKAKAKTECKFVTSRITQDTDQNAVF